MTFQKQKISNLFILRNQRYPQNVKRNLPFNLGPLRSASPNPPSLGSRLFQRIRSSEVHDDTQVEKVLAATSNSNVTVFDVDLYDLYLEEARPKLKEIFNYKNDHEIPKITKIIVNQTYPEKSNLKGLNNALNELSVITAQKGVLTRAKKSIAGFGITKGDPLGLKVTLRRKRMYGFLHRLIHLSFPRIRDFRGLNPLSFDGFGNYTFGVEEQLMFPEMNPESAQSSQGLHISIVTSAKTNKEAYFLLKLLGMPFQKNEFWDSSAE